MELLINITELDPTVCKVAHLLVLLGVYSATRTKLGNEKCTVSDVSIIVDSFNFFRSRPSILNLQIRG